MNKPWILTPLARIGLFVLILGLGLGAIASQAEQLAVADRFNRLAQAVGNVLRDIEALVWRLPVSEILVVVAFVVLIALVISLYLTHFRPRSLHQPRYIGLLALLLLLFAGIAWVMVTDHKLLSYLFPAATLSVMVAVLFDVHLSILVTALMGFVLGHLAGGSLELAVYGMMGGLIGVLSMGQGKHLNRLLWSGAYVALSNIIVILIFHLSNNHPTDLLELMAIG
ncbi:MAG: hypothetical protein HYR94_24190, partial [Chloroflexi bacterium]|nr:hypothetical protein [Chloroflexota bacterium]